MFNVKALTKVGAFLKLTSSFNDDILNSAMEKVERQL